MCVADKWENSLQSIYKTTDNNMLRQFSFKIVHRILVTKKYFQLNMMKMMKTL